MLDQQRQTYIIRADKVVSHLRALGIAEFVRKFGIRSVVAEANTFSWPCNDFREHAAMMNAERASIPIESNINELQGTIELFQLPVTNPAANTSLKLPIESTGDSVDVRF